jgi:tellurite resistance-related uncharacterized protein
LRRSDAVFHESRRTTETPVFVPAQLMTGAVTSALVTGTRKCRQRSSWSCDDTFAVLEPTGGLAA